MRDRQAELDKQIADLKETLIKKESEVEAAETKAEVKVETKVETREDVDPFLEEALKLGYDPNYHGVDKKTPEQFVKDGSFFRKIKEQKKEIQEIKKVLHDMTEHAKKLEQIEYTRRMDELNTKKQQAVRNADEIEFNKLEIEQEKLKKESEITKAPKFEAPLPIPEEVQDFVKRNKDWFNLDNPENTLMAKAADGLFTLEEEKAKLSGKSISNREILTKVEEEIKRMFPKRFENTNKERPAMVATSTVSKDGKTKSLAGRLTPQQKQFVKAAASYGSKLTEEEYAKQLDLIGGLPSE